MYDLKVNYTFMPHNRDHNKPTIGNFGVECLACTGKNYNASRDGSGWHNRTEGNEKPVNQENKVNSECNS